MAFEPDTHRRCIMHKHRIKALEKLADDINSKLYLVSAALMWGLHAVVCMRLQIMECCCKSVGCLLLGGCMGLRLPGGAYCRRTLSRHMLLAQGLYRSAQLECGNVYRDISEIKAADGREPGKVAQAALKAIGYLEKFLETYEEELSSGKRCAPALTSTCHRSHRHPHAFGAG